MFLICLERAFVMFFDSLMYDVASFSLLYLLPLLVELNFYISK